MLHGPSASAGADIPVLPAEGGFALLSNVSVDHSGRFAVCAVSFDKFEELIWAGTTKGTVSSYYRQGSILDKYTTFRAVSSSESQPEIRAVDTIEAGVLALSAKQLKCNRRQGLNHFNFSSANMIDVHCMNRLSASRNGSLILAGNQQKILSLDLETRKEQRVVEISEPNAMILRSNSKFLFSSDNKGQITLRNLQTLDSIHGIQAHLGPIADFDIFSNRLVTCGYSPRMGQLSSDRFLMIYDLRTLRPMTPNGLPFTPSFIRFISSYSEGRVVVASEMGEFQVFEITENSGIPCQMETENGASIFCIDTSSSKQCIAFGDSAGTVHLLSDRVEPTVNENSWPTEFADAAVMAPSISFEDDLTPLAMIPLPYPCDGEYLSDWPPELCKRVYSSFVGGQK